MNEETLQQAFNWFKERGYQVDMDIDNLCLYLIVWNKPLSDCTDILLSTSEVEHRAELYKNSNK
jgi:hypothetical protein